MHILFLSHYFPPESNAPANRTFEHARRWVRAGHRVTVLTCNPNHPDGKLYHGYRNPPVQREIVEGIEVLRVWTFLAPNAGAVRRILNFLVYMMLAVFRGFFVRRVDIVLATSPQFFCGVAGMLLSTLRRKVFVLEIRDIWPQSIVTVGAMRPGLHIRMLEWLERLMYRSATHIVTVGEGYRRELLSRGVPSEALSVIPNGIDHEAFIPKDGAADVRAELGLQEKFLCSFVGTVGMAHGLDVLLDAAELLNERHIHDITFLVIGDGAERKRLSAEASARGLSGQVIFHGRVSRSEVPAVLSQSDVVLVHLKKSSLFETVLPSKLFEPMAFAKPILLGVDGDARLVLEESGAGVFFEPENAAALVEALLSLRADTVRSQQMAANGPEFVRSHYNRETLAQRYQEILEHLHRNEGR